MQDQNVVTGEKEIMKLAINSIVFVAAVVLAGCEKKVEAPAVADAGLPEKPACCETAAPPAVDADGGVPVAPLTAPVASSTATPAVAPVAAAPAATPTPAPVAAPTTTIKK